VYNSFYIGSYSVPELIESWYTSLVSHLFPKVRVNYFNNVAVFVSMFGVIKHSANKVLLVRDY